MRFMTLLLSILLWFTVTSAQQKYLVSPNDEVIPLKRGQSAAAVVAKRQAQAHLAQSQQACTNRFTFGYPENIFPANSNFGAYHKDVMGEWFVAKATGSIDTVFWEALGSVGALDSTL